MKGSNDRIIGIPEGVEKNRGLEEIFEQIVAEGRLGGTAVKRLPSAQGVIPALWDRDPHQALLL